jgi:hypothetical protein
MKLLGAYAMLVVLYEYIPHLEHCYLKLVHSRGPSSIPGASRF